MLCIITVYESCAKMSMVLVSFMVKRNHPMKVAWWGKFPAQKTHSMGNGSHENGILVQVTEVVHFHQLALSKFALFWLVLHHDLMKGFSNGIMPLCIHWSHHNKRRHDVANTTPHGERLHVPCPRTPPKLQFAHNKTKKEQHMVVGASLVFGGI